MSELGKFLRENFDKLLLFIIFLITISVVVHFSHHGADTDQVLWAREMAGTVLGGLLGLITGHAIATRTTASTPTSSITSTTEPK